jgi:hypothetical protein
MRLATQGALAGAAGETGIRNSRGRRTDARAAERAEKTGFPRRTPRELAAAATYRHLGDSPFWSADVGLDHENHGLPISGLA